MCSAPLFANNVAGDPMTQVSHQATGGRNNPVRRADVTTDHLRTASAECLSRSESRTAIGRHTTTRTHATALTIDAGGQCRDLIVGYALPRASGRHSSPNVGEASRWLILRCAIEA